MFSYSRVCDRRQSTTSAVQEMRSSTDIILRKYDESLDVPRHEEQNALRIQDQRARYIKKPEV
jgi:hypothetical protein